MGKLIDLVPPQELCEQLPEGAFKDSALVHVRVHVLDDILKIEDIVPRACLEHCKDLYSVMAPAPTLQEIMDELFTKSEGTLEYLNCDRTKIGWCVDVTYECHDDSGYGSDGGSEADKHNPAAAALRLYLERYGNDGA